MEAGLRHPKMHSPQGHGGPWCSPRSPPPLLRPWRAQVCSPGGRRPGRGRTPARVLSGCWWTVPAAPRWPGDSQPHPRPVRPPPPLTCSPTVPGTPAGPGGPGSPCNERGGNGGEQGQGWTVAAPRCPPALPPTSRLSLPGRGGALLQGGGACPMACVPHGPQPSPTSPPGRGGPLCCPPGSVLPRTTAEGTWPHAQPVGEARRRPPAVAPGAGRQGLLRTH